MVCVIFAASLTASASDGSEIFVVPANLNGAASYLVSNGDGTFSSQQSQLSLESASASGIGGGSYGNGIGDFDGDGDLDYIMASGFWAGHIYLFEKLGPGNQFKAPVAVSQWDLGFFPMDMAVADFNEDGNLDFVMSYDFSGTCGLYLGHGDLSFSYTPLPVTAPMFSSGADAADFDNDGHADFVIAPDSYDHEFYVSLGNGDGTFVTLIFDSYGLSFYDGVAAADFNNDGNVDLAAAHSGYLDIYTGNGDGTFGSGQRYEGQEHSNSPLDNYDFDGDGNQDLVAASYGVAVYMGNGNGTFSYSSTYGDEGKEQLWSVSAAPFILNTEPVAVVESAYPDVSVGEAIEFSGSGSWDEDGEIAGYAWEFGDGTPPAEGETVGHTYSDVGVYTVTLTVTDDRWATASATTEVTVVEAQLAAVEMRSVQAVPAKIKFSPGRLDLNGKGKKKNKWIKAKIKLPKGYDARKIDLSTVCIFPAMEKDSVVEFAYLDPKHGLKAKKSKKNYKSKKEITVKFDRQKVMGLITNPSKKMIMNVQGYMSHNGGEIEFSGAGKLKIKMRKGKGKDK